MSKEQQNSSYSSGGNIIPTPEEASTFQPQVVAEGGWEKCWEDGVTPWDQGRATPLILHPIDTSSLPLGRTLVPGCGGITDHAGGAPYEVSVSAYEDVLVPLGFKAVSIEENPDSIPTRKGKEKIGRWKNPYRFSCGSINMKGSCYVTQDVPMSLKCMKQDKSQIHKYIKGNRCVSWGYEVNTSSDDCIAAINSYSHQVLGYGRERKVILEAPLYDTDCVLGNILAAHYLISSDITRAKTYARAAEYHLGKATPYEKAVFKAVNYLISDDVDEDVALELHSKLLKKFPKDLLSWKRVEILCFYMGRPDLSLPLFEKILAENREQDYVYGMLAFPLLELGHLAEAEKAARKGYEINKNDSWAHHCLCHVLQTECRFKEAVEFMEGCSASWDSCSSLRFSHNWWHVAVCYLEGGSPTSKVQEIYDHQMCKELEKEDAVATDVYMDALGLLLRLDTRDKLDEFLDRLKILANCLTDQAMWYQEWLFDITTIWALSKVGNTSGAHVLLEGLKSRTSHMSKKKQELMQKAIQLAEAVNEYGKGNYKEALELLGTEFDAVAYKVIGASDLQIDVFNEIWYKLLLLTGQSSIAIKVLERRIKQRDGAPFLWRLLEKSYAMEGNTEAVVNASEKAKALESSYFKFA